MSLFDGKAQAPCNVCNKPKDRFRFRSAGKIECSCGGLETCSACKGTGLRDCWQCGGTGLVERGSPGALFLTFGLPRRAKCREGDRCRFSDGWKRGGTRALKGYQVEAVARFQANTSPTRPSEIQRSRLSEPSVLMWISISRASCSDA